MRLLTIGLITLVLIFLAGCTSGTDVPESTPFVGGNVGLLLSFTAGAPPDEVLDDGQFEFNVNVRVENQGEYDIENGDGYVELQGISANEFGVSEGELSKDIPAIEGAKKGIDGSNIDGFLDAIDFDGLNFQSDIAGSLDTVVRAHACYNYETAAVANLCIKEDTLDDLETNEVCMINGEKFHANSGGPIQVKKVVESPRSRDGVTVLITIGTVGPVADSWYKPDTDCDNKRNNPDRYTVYVEIDPIVNGAISADCSGLTGGGDSGYITLYNGEDRQFSCSFDTSSVNTDFETRMNMKLRYRYSQFIEKMVRIKDVPARE